MTDPKVELQRRIRQEADMAAKNFAGRLQDDTTGIPRPPTIELTETALEPEKFGLNLNSEPNAESNAYSGRRAGDEDDGGGGEAPTYETVTGAVNGVPATLVVATDGDTWVPL